MKTLSIVAITAFAFLALANFASAQGVFQVTSSTFMPNMPLPLSMIFNRTEADCRGHGRGNVCVLNCTSFVGNKSPQLSWTNVPPGTTSFVVIAFDATAGFTHWGMYNIPATTTMLPLDAGVVGSPIGPQIVNVYDGENPSANQRYGGPCPPRIDPAHDYMFEVFALNEELALPPTANGELLLHSLLDAAVRSRLLARASITGCYASGRALSACP
jgi:Raf kinase inhibitor-like YbhB/YbcL family protein